MKERWTDDQIAGMLKEADRELAKGLIVPDVCRKIGIAQAAYYRWRQRHDPGRIAEDRRRRELEAEVERSSGWSPRGPCQAFSFSGSLTPDPETSCPTRSGGR